MGLEAFDGPASAVPTPTPATATSVPAIKQFVGAPRSFWTPTVKIGRNARASPRLALPAAMFEVAFAMPATVSIAV